MIGYLASLGLGGLLGVNVYMIVTTGAAISWAAAAFLCAMIGYIWVQELKR